MASNENRYGSQQLWGNTDVPFIAIPALRGSVRRNDPDGSHVAPWFSGLNGTSLTLEVTPTGLVTINFVSDDYQTAISTINSTAPSDLLAEDADGFIKINSRHAGGVNYLKSVSGAAAAIIGLRLFPVPGSISYCGELDSAPSGGKFQQNPEGTELLGHDEDLTSRSVNRAIVGALLHNDMFLRELEREHVTYERIDGVTFYTHPIDGTVVFKITDPTLRIPLKLFGATTPGATDTPNLLDQIVQVMTAEEGETYESGVATGLYAQGLAVEKLRVDSIHYGTDATALSAATSFAAWGTPDGKSIFGNSAHWQKLKVPNTAITDIKGNVLVAPGALFVTKNVQAGDTIVITSATNDSPFSHNGEFVVETVHDEDTISVRAKSVYEDLVFVGSARPTKLNQNTLGGSGAVLGDVKVPVGFFLPATSLIFKLNRTWVAGTYAIRLAVGRQLRTNDQASLVRTIQGGNDNFWAAFYDHITNTENRHPASAIDKQNNTTWANGNTLLAQQLEDWTDQLIVQLADQAGAGADGASRIGAAVESPGQTPRTFGSNSNLGTQKDQLLTFLNDHLNQLIIAGNIHSADHINYAGGPVFASGASNPAKTAPLGVESAIDTLISNLNSTTLGVGFLNQNRLWTASQVFNGDVYPGDETIASLSTTFIPTDRKLLWIFRLGSKTTPSGSQAVHGRIYASAQQALNAGLSIEFTINAYWDGSTWVRDANADASMFGLVGGGSSSGLLNFQLVARTRYRVDNSTNTWNDAENSTVGWHESQVIWAGPSVPTTATTGASSTDNFSRAATPKMRNHRSDDSISARSLIWELPGLAANHDVRFYRSNVDSEALEIAINCNWNFVIFTTNKRWNYDNSANKATVIRITRNSLSIVQRAASSDPSTDGNTYWLDAAGSTGWASGYPLMSFDYSSSNPSSTASWLNALTPKNLPKAFASIHLTSGTISVDDGFNVSSVSVTMSPSAGIAREDWITVNLAGNMTDGNYTVQVNFAEVGAWGEDGGGGTVFAAVPIVINRGVGSFQVKLKSCNSIGHVNLKTSGVLWSGRFLVTVFGPQDPP